MGIGQILKRSISTKYLVGSIFVSMLVVISCVSYAMFTVTEEKNNAISIVTGSLYYQLTVDGTNTTSVSVPANITKTYTVVLTNNNNRTARFNFYYVGDLASNVEIGYLTSGDIPPAVEGINLDANASQTYQIQVMNNSSNTTTINLGVSVGLDYNDLSLPNDGHLLEGTQPTVAETLLAGVGENGSINTSDPDQTFITGEEPNNYIWYSGKLWRAVSIDPDDNSVKLVTQWNISAIPYNESGNTAFEGSYMEQWLNDTSVDGFLGNLRDYENFIKTDSVWNATLTTATTKPAETTTVEDTVGLLNIYEYTMSYSGTTYQNGYLNNGLFWWLLTPYSSSSVRTVNSYGGANNIYSPTYAYGVRPSINLKSSVKIVSGDGSENNPYRLEGDNDSNVNGILLNTRYSGEYIKFGTGENTLYRIVSHETKGLTKITSAEALKSGGSFITSAFDSGRNVNYSSSNTIGAFLNGEYLTSYVGSSYRNMIEPSTTWYLGTVGNGASYRLAKYSSATGNDLTTNTTTAQVGLLRFGELMAGQFDRYAIKGGSSSTGFTTDYWTLTPYGTSLVRYVYRYGNAIYYSPSTTYGTRPAMNLKSSVMITGGSGTKSDPFVLSLGS